VIEFKFIIYSNVLMDIDSVGISGDDGLLVLQVVSEALSLGEALPLRLVCLDLRDTIGARVTTLIYPRSRPQRIPMVSEYTLRYLTKIDFRFQEPETVYNELVDSLISAAESWKDLRSVHVFKWT
jgi:hypothetical protein